MSYSFSLITVLLWCYTESRYYNITPGGHSCNYYYPGTLSFSQVTKINLKIGHSYLTGWPRSGWPQVGHFDQKIKVNQIASYCAMLYPRCCSLWPVLFGGCIPPPLTPLQAKPEALILISIGGWTLQCGVMYIFHVLVFTRIDFYHLLWNWKVKRLIKQKKKEIKMCLFVFENKWQHVTSNTQFRLAQIRVATFLHIRLQFCHRGKSPHKSSVTLWNDDI